MAEDVGDSNREEDTHNQLQQGDKEFIRKLANDYLHFKIYGSGQNTIADLLDAENAERRQRRISRPRRTISDDNNNDTTEETGGKKDSGSFKKTAKILRKVSVELERTNSNFFDNVCSNLSLEQGNPERTFKLVSEEVLSHETLNWGRVVSLFTFGGKLAEWFWSTQQQDKIDELEDWLTESLSTKEDWIKQRGGWVSFGGTSFFFIFTLYHLGVCQKYSID